MNNKKFFTDEDKIYIKENLDKILQYYGAVTPNKSGNNWTCIKSRHANDSRNNLTVTNNICCCHCGLKGDALNVISILDDYHIQKDFPKIIEKGLYILGCDLSNNNRSHIEDKQVKNENKKQYEVNNFNLTKIITDYFANMKYWQYKYFFKRGIKNKDIFNKYLIIVGNPKNIFPRELLPNLVNLSSYRNIIPVWEECKIVNCLLRRDDKYSIYNAKILNLKNLPVKIFNLDYLKKLKDNEFIFITEGIFDALTYEQIGFKGIALNSTSMINYFFNQIIKYKDKIISQNVKFILSLDNDYSGIDASNRLDDKLRSIGIQAFILRFKNYKDSNQLYKVSPNFFIREINKIINNIKFIN